MSNRSLAVSLVFRLAAISLMVCGTGCLVTSHSSESHSGNYVSDSTFDQIKPAQTTTAWVKATLGEPTRVTKVDDGTELWDYAYSEEKTSSGAIFLIFGGSNVKESTHHAFVEFKGGLATRAWRG